MLNAWRLTPRFNYLADLGMAALYEFEVQDLPSTGKPPAVRTAPPPARTTGKLTGPARGSTGARRCGARG